MKRCLFLCNSMSPFSRKKVYGGESYVNVLRVYPDDEEAYQAASTLYHNGLFQFPQAFTLNWQWLERHPDDLAALSGFAEKHLTTRRFAECAQRLTALLANPEVIPQV